MNKLRQFINTPTSIAPLVVIRIIFGLIMSFSMIRFISNGWVNELYVQPKMYFPYFGFEWIKPLPELGMYLLFIGLSISFLMVALGAFYRFSISFSFLAFTYIELIDKTNYLNHYYFVSLFCFLLIFLPAHRYFSIDAKLNPGIESRKTSRINILILQIQLALVYFFAGFAKLNYDWLVEAMPLKIWLPSKSDLWLIGGLLKEEWMAYLFSWGGALYDLFIPIALFNRKSRPFAYLLVIVFHMLTYWLFQIGMFPFIMIGATLIFFSEEYHQKILDRLSPLFKLRIRAWSLDQNRMSNSTWKTTFFGLFLLFQLALPMRYLLYPGELFWTEEGYRFSWRVMLMEKAGYCIFSVEDPDSKRSWEVNNYEFLTPNQEKMMSTQADMILQFAQHLKAHYQKNGIENPIITVKSYVSLNGERSKLLIDPKQNLSSLQDNFSHKNWIMPPPAKYLNR